MSRPTTTESRLLPWNSREDPRVEGEREGKEGSPVTSFRLRTHSKSRTSQSKNLFVGWRRVRSKSGVCRQSEDT